MYTWAADPSSVSTINSSYKTFCHVPTNIYPMGVLAACTYVLPYPQRFHKKWSNSGMTTCMMLVSAGDVGVYLSISESRVVFNSIGGHKRQKRCHY